MEDLRDAEKTVSEFATLIDNLRPADNTSHLGGDFPDLLTQRQNSTGSQKSGKGSIGSRWRPRTLKKDWGETTEGICKYRSGDSMTSSPVPLATGRNI